MRAIPNRTRFGAFLAAALLVVGGGLLTSTVAAAKPVQLTPTRIVISIVPNPVSYPSPHLTITGTLQTLTGKNPQPIPGEPVGLVMTWEAGAASQDLGIVTTDSSGRFTATATALAPGAIVATFAGDGAYAAGHWEASFAAASQLPAQVTVEPVTPTPYGSAASVTVQLTMELPDHTWVPAPYAPIRPDGCGGPQSNKTGWTDASGVFTAQIPADPSAFCTFYSAATAWDSWTSPIISQRVIIPLTTFPTQIQYFGPDALVNDRVPIDALGFGGFAYYEDGSGALNDYPDAPVQLYFKASGAATWTLLEATHARADGIFHFPPVSGYLPHGRLATGLWKAVIPQSGPYFSSDAVNYAVVLAVPVFMRGVKIHLIRHHRYLTGTLDYLPHGGPLHGVLVTLLATTSQDPHAHRVATARTNAQGFFSFQLAKHKLGNTVAYQVWYRGGPIPSWAGDPAYAVFDAGYSADFVLP